MPDRYLPRPNVRVGADVRSPGWWDGRGVQIIDTELGARGDR
jgi:hypothetical protein